MLNEKLVLMQAVKEAGAAVLALQCENMFVAHKLNRDVLTEADVSANQIIKEHILAAFPEDGWLSEESADDATRLSKSRVWIVDPIDGTREYVKNIPEYAVSVALIENGAPRLAAVFNPATNELFFAEAGKGAWMGQQKLQCRADVNHFILLASRSEFERGEWDQFAEYNVQVIGSIAYKLALVAAGKASATFSLSPKNEWDIAAGVLLIQEAGGTVTDKSFTPFIFNQAKTKVNGIIAGSKAAFAVLQSTLF